MGISAQGKCPRCQAVVQSGAKRCGKCGIWFVNTGNASAKQDDGLDHDGTILFSNVKSAAANRINTPICSAIFGTSKLPNGKDLHGVVNTSAVMIGGQRGAGKSTLLSQLLSEISLVTERETLYVCCEESKEERKLSLDRLGIKNQHQMRVIEALSGCGNVADLVGSHKPAAVAIDSLRGLVGKDIEGALAACRLCKTLGVEHHCPFFIIQHMTKEDQISGSNDDQHEVDTVMTFFVDTGAIRSLDVEKNRFGRAYISQKYRMTDHGLEIVGGVVVPDEGEDEDEDEDE
jgi:predicted ATP-dependent serine protease